MTPAEFGKIRRPRPVARAGRALAALFAGAAALAVTAAPANADPGLPASGTLTWSIKPAVQPVEVVEFEPHQLERGVNAVWADTDATVPAGSTTAVEVRGLTAEGTWTEWAPITADEFAVLPRSTQSVQTRLLVTRSHDGASPEVREIDLTAWQTS
ncbi:hypothetical protein [Amycolatopsis anabasis]|uniref:hypothetical protein n=1 Tax=Amycolatopsis anabasis TaxID=1840409 RepID=UPI00131BFAB7|nr:hypothetical protein [Amycolatopsis anabasis]